MIPFIPTRKELHNMFGWHTKRHLVVIESDDWGSIRMPSREVYDEFLRQGVRVDKDAYCRYDNLATKHDLENLFEVLNSVKDKNGHPAVITANTLSANPVFDKIRESNFTQYFYEPFTETLKRDEAHKDAFEMWEQGMAAGVFHPQCHGREHLYVKKWLNALQSNDYLTRLSFDLGTWGLTHLVDKRINQYYMGAFDSGLPDDLEEFKKIIDEALKMFHQTFGYESRSFVATTYSWNPAVETAMVDNGVRYIQGEFAQKIPIDDDQTFVVQKRGFQGTRTKAGLIRLFRNCFYEPSTHPNDNIYADCMKRIELAFKWGKAANICAHRVNFIGSIDSANTDRNLPEFKRLLQEIVKRWPDVEFVTSDQLGEIIESSNQRLWKF
ncbi:MAG: hypothetical protein MJZ20_04830 [Bacteroidaceae bacterium]|nr:hypothetical protein [Bacteroidaceae bacterium]